MGSDKTVGLQSQAVVANKVITIGGVEYAPGDSFDTTGLSRFKIGQLLNQRILRPAGSDDRLVSKAPVAEEKPPVVGKPVTQTTVVEDDDPVLDPVVKENTDEVPAQA